MKPIIIAVALLTLASPAPADMDADTPFQFPKTGPLPAKYPPDLSIKDWQHPEKDYFMAETPERSLRQVEQIQATMPKGTFTLPPTDWTHLARTRRALAEGRPLRLLAVGDSIVNDTMRSGWVSKLRAMYPKAAVTAKLYVRGGGGCQHYKQERRVGRFVVPFKPDLVLLGGISQQDAASIKEVVRQLRTELPNVEVLLFSGTFGTADPRSDAELAKAPHSGTGPYGAALKKLAAEERCAYLDMTTPWAAYVRSSKVHPYLFYRDVVHANEFGEQILAKILTGYFAGAAGKMGEGRSLGAAARRS